MRKLVIAGANGYIGNVLVNYFKDSVDEIILISRTPKPAANNVRTEVWNGRDAGAWCAALENTDLLVNLAGKSVNCRYTEQAKKEILDSRLFATQALGNAISSLTNPPKVWIQVASATIYRHAEDRAMDEATGEIGEGFSVEVCKAWEKTFCEQPVKCRKILLRTSIVIGNSDGAFPRLVNLTRYGLGGKQDNGQQRISWIHEEDLARMMKWLYEQDQLSGTFNAAAPDPVTNERFMHFIQKAMNVFVALPAPAWLLKIGALIIGTETELILKSRWVIPTRLLDAGFQFQHPHAEQAIKNLVSSR